MMRSIFCPMTILCLAMLSLPRIALGQAQPPPSDTVVPSSNIRGAQYPRVTTDLRVIFRIKAPDAQKVEFNLGKHYPAAKDADGFWSVTTDPQAPGFHYYSLIIDGIQVNDPASESFYGTGRQSSGIEVPEAGVDYYLPKDGPHGDVREEWYHSSTTGAWRRARG